MSPTWRAFVMALLGFASSSPDTSGFERGLAVVAAAGWLCLDRRLRRRAGFVLIAFLLGAVGGWRLTQTVARSAAWADRESEVLISLSSDLGAERWSVELGHPELGSVSARLRAFDSTMREGDLWRARVEVFSLPRTRNPDDRRALRSALASGSLLYARVRENASRIRSVGPSRMELIRTAAARRWEQTMGEGSGFWRALLLADRRDLDRLARRSVQDQGFAHLLALSGLHVGVVLGLLLLPLRRWGRRGVVVLLPALAAWAWIAGASPSMVRSVTMVGLIAAAHHLRRPASTIDALAAVGLVELALRPQVVCGIGWWLSYSATLAILRSIGWVRGRNLIVSGIAISVVAQLATLPWILDAFGRLPLLAPLALLLVGPLFTLVLSVGGVCAVLALVPWPLASFFGGLAAAFAHAFGFVLAVNAPTGNWAFHHPGLDDRSWAMAMVLVGLWLIPGQGPNLRRRGLVTVVLMLLVHGPTLRAHTVAKRHEWVSFDVGQGDAGIYRCGRRILLIDSGPLARSRLPVDTVLLPYLERRSIDDIQLVLTHGHLDHTAGAPSLLASGRVKTLIMATVDRHEKWATDLERIASVDSIAVRWIAAGDTIWAGCCDALCLWPPADAELEHANDRSVVLRLGPRTMPLLAPGDLERRGERPLVDLLKANLDRANPWMLKVAHHGGNTGTDSELLELLDPSVAIVSCGAGNRYGHPHPAVLERLGEGGIEILRTDRHGAIVIDWRGSSAKVRSVGGRP